MAKLDVMSPMDFYGVYLTANRGIAQRLSLATIQNRLAALPLFDVLEVLAQISYMADKSYTISDGELLANRLLRPAHAAQAIRVMRSSGGARPALFSSQLT